jgi:hypothetical protein
MPTDPPEPLAKDSAAPGRSKLFALIGLGIVLTLGAIAAAGALKAVFQEPQTKGEADPPAGGGADDEFQKFAGKYFHNWHGRKPDAVLILTGQVHLYEEPCGCTRPLLGGLERRYNVIKQMRGMGIDVVPLDLGDVYFTEQKTGKPRLTDQMKLKYRLMMKAMNEMEYAAIAVGEHEFRYPLLDALAETVLNNKVSYKVLVANMTAKSKEDNFPGMLHDSQVTGKNIKVGVIGAMGDSVVQEIKKIDPAAQFTRNSDAIPAGLKALAEQKPEVRVLLYQGTVEEAETLAQAIPDFDLILCLSSESEPHALPTVIGKTRIIRVGHKGRMLGVAAFFRNEDKIKLEYELLPLQEEFATPKGQEGSNPILRMLEDYTREVRDKGFLTQYPQGLHPSQVVFGNGKPVPNYVGSKKCQECHKKEYEIWDQSKHAEAIKALEEKAKNPSNRQFDGECIVCHTTGFAYETGYRDAKRTPQLQEVGCESCHGTGSLHVENSKDPKYYLSMSPWKENPKDRLPVPKVEVAIDTKTCQICHDVDNDPNFKFAKFWPKIEHGKKPEKKAEKK